MHHLDPCYVSCSAGVLLWLWTIWLSCHLADNNWQYVNKCYYPQILSGVANLSYKAPPNKAFVLFNNLFS